ncbi:MAG: MFS transporter [Deltaproteobacteria bacterium]|nr:MFS transporter [Deltaproteobacteria bacterium]
MSTLHQKIRADHNLRYSVYDAIAWAFMFGFAEMYISPFAIYLNSTPQQIGMLSTLPPLIGASCQLLGLFLTENYRNRRQIICTAVWFQAFALSLLAFLPLLLPFLDTPFALLFALICIYHISGNIGGPAWHSLLGELIPSSIRIHFLALRNSRVAIYTFIAYIIGGLILDQFEHWSRISCGYAMLFAFASFGRFLSYSALTRHDNPLYTAENKHIFSPTFLWQTIFHSSYGRFILFFCLIHFGANIAGPYFSIYMLRELRLSYMEFTTLVGIQVFSQFLSMRFWAWLGKDMNTTKLLELSGFTVSTLPFLWILSADYSYLMVVQTFSGFFWGGFNLAAQNYLFKNLSTEVRARMSAYQLLLNAIFIFLGSSLGGMIIKYSSLVGLVGNNWWQFSTPLFIAFFVSGSVRLLTAKFLRPH